MWKRAKKGAKPDTTRMPHKLNVISYVAGNGINITDTVKEPKHSMFTSHLLRRMYILKDLHHTVE